MRVLRPNMIVQRLDRGALADVFVSPVISQNQQAMRLAQTHVLVVEDEPLILMDIEDFLARWGVGKVTGVASIEKAMEAPWRRHRDTRSPRRSFGGRDRRRVRGRARVTRRPICFHEWVGKRRPAPGSRRGSIFRETVDWPSLQAAMASALRVS